MSRPCHFADKAEHDRRAAMIKCGGKYIVAGSDVRGWACTDSYYAVADHPLGPYSSPLPPGVVCGEFLNKDGTKLLTVLHNASGKPATVKGVSYPPGNLSFNINSLKNKE